jgi:hypothetical protein
VAKSPQSGLGRDLIGAEASDVKPVAAGHRREYFTDMSTVQEIQDAITHLSSEDLAAFRQWFDEFDAALWDAQMEADVTSGRLDELGEEALRDLREGRCADL